MNYDKCIPFWLIYFWNEEDLPKQNSSLAYYVSWNFKHLFMVDITDWWFGYAKSKKGYLRLVPIRIFEIQFQLYFLPGRRAKYHLELSPFQIINSFVGQISHIFFHSHTDIRIVVLKASLWSLPRIYFKKYSFYLIFVLVEFGCQQTSFYFFIPIVCRFVLVSLKYRLF